MPLLELTVVALVVLLVVLARGQMVRARRQKRLMLRRALASPDPAARRAAIQVAGDEGLARSAEEFLRLVRLETDASVLLVLAQVVVRNQWEPAHDPAMVRLRLWAHRYVDALTSEEPEPSAGGRNRRFEGPTAGEVVNLLLQSTSSRRSHRRPRPRRRTPSPREWA